MATLTDVTFWIKNWELALAVALDRVSGADRQARRQARAAARARRRGHRLGDSLGHRAIRAAPGGFPARRFHEAAPIVGRAIALVYNAVKAGLGRVEAFVVGLFPRLGRAAVFTAKVLGLSAIISAVGDMAAKVKRVFLDLIAAIPGYATQALGAAVSIGTAMIQGMVNGITGAAGNLARAAVNAVTGAFSAAKNAILSHSPSRLWATLGVDTIRGYIVGIDSSLPKLNEKTAEAVTKALDAARVAVERKQESFRATFDRLGEYAGRAFEGRTAAILSKIGARFDAAIGRWGDYAQALTPAEAQLRSLQAGEEQRQRDLAIASASAARDAAETEEQRLAAVEQMRQA